MENEQQMKEAACRYAESLFDSPEINKADEAYENSVKYHTKLFIDGVSWAAEHEHASYGKAEKVATQYARENAESEEMEDAVSSFMEGVEWYKIEVAQIWIRKEIIYNGQKGYTIEEKASRLRQFFTSTAGEIIIAVALGLIAVLALLINFAG